jgi:hypothetical protein
MGSVASQPASLWAQQRERRVVGFLNSVSAAQGQQLAQSFLTGLREADYIEGENVTVE